jgi:hypothetical protein
MVLNEAQKQIFLKTETSSLAKKNSYCHRNDCKIQFLRAVVLQIIIFWDACHISCKTVTYIFQVLGFLEILLTVHQIAEHTFPGSLNLQQE